MVSPPMVRSSAAHACADVHYGWFSAKPRAFATNLVIDSVVNLLSLATSDGVVSRLVSALTCSSYFPTPLRGPDFPAQPISSDLTGSSAFPVLQPQARLKLQRYVSPIEVNPYAKLRAVRRPARPVVRLYTSLNPRLFFPPSSLVNLAVGLAPGPVEYPVDYLSDTEALEGAVFLLPSRFAALIHARRIHDPVAESPLPQTHAARLPRTQQECDQADQDDGPCAPRAPKAEIAAIIAAAAQKAEEQRALLEAAAVAEVQSKEEERA
ncbi:hypothetical protein EDB86DRAFT_2836512 [Lactarius hatsudake]|nr:hypothetical protein EDB86DRAFT_2836512 [Lactarius hatsudake]